MKPKILTSGQWRIVKKARNNGFDEYHPGQPSKTLRAAVFFLDALDRAERLQRVQAQAEALHTARA